MPARRSVTKAFESLREPFLKLDLKSSRLNNLFVEAIESKIQKLIWAKTLSGVFSDKTRGSNCSISYCCSMLSVSYAFLFSDKSMECPILCYSNLFIAEQLYGLGKKFLRTALLIFSKSNELTFQLRLVI